MHEFEALLFSDCARFADGIGRPGLAPELQTIRNSFDTPEEINDSPDTHPAQRILNLLPEYQKPLFGNIAALEIGFESMHEQCPHFSKWMAKLESLVK